MRGAGQEEGEARQRCNCRQNAWRHLPLSHPGPSATSATRRRPDPGRAGHSHHTSRPLAQGAGRHLPDTSGALCGQASQCSSPGAGPKERRAAGTSHSRGTDASERKGFREPGRAQPGQHAGPRGRAGWCEAPVRRWCLEGNRDVLFCVRKLEEGQACAGCRHALEEPLACVLGLRNKLVY